MAVPRFSKQTLQFIQKASRQKKAGWLEKNKQEYESLVLRPLQNLAQNLKRELAHLAPGYHFPQKGIGRLKRTSRSVAANGSLYKDWLSYSAALPRTSRFDHNPNVFFLIYPDDPDGETVLIAGGLYMPSSRQMRAIREAIATDATPFDRLFDSKAFSASFKGGFATEKKSSRCPRGFDVDHARMEWLKLQAFFVWKPYKMRDFTSDKFAQIVADDARQILRLNALLEQILSGRWTHTVAKTQTPKTQTKPSDLATRLDFEAIRRPLDF